MKYDEAVGYYLEFGRSKNLSPRTIEFYEFTLKRFVEHLPPGLLVEETTVRHLRAASAEFMEKVSLTTVNHAIRVGRMLFKYLSEEEYIEKNPAMKWAYVKQPKVIITPFSPDQINKLLSVPDQKTFVGLRDVTIMSLLTDTGLRASECLGIRLPDVDLVNTTIRVMGKGSKERIVPFGVNTRRWLRAYMNRRGSQPSDLLFVTEYGEGVTVFHLDHRLKLYAKKANVTDVKVSSHQFRRVFAVNFLRNGGDLFSLQKLLGHTSLEMVRRYANLNDDDVRNAHRQFSPLDRMVDTGKVTAKVSKSGLKKRRKRIK